MDDLQKVRKHILLLYSDLLKDRTFLQVNPFQFFHYRIDSLRNMIIRLQKNIFINYKNFIPIFIVSEQIKLSFRNKDVHKDTISLVLNSLNNFEKNLINKSYEDAKLILDKLEIDMKFCKISNYDSKNYSSLLKKELN